MIWPYPQSLWVLLPFSLQLVENVAHFDIYNDRPGHFKVCNFRMKAAIGKHLEQNISGRKISMNKPGHSQAQKNAVLNKKLWRMIGLPCPNFLLWVNFFVCFFFSWGGTFAFVLFNSKWAMLVQRQQFVAAPANRLCGSGWNFKVCLNLIAKKTSIERLNGEFERKHNYQLEFCVLLIDLAKIWSWQIVQQCILWCKSWLLSVNCRQLSTVDNRVVSDCLSSSVQCRYWGQTSSTNEYLSPPYSYSLSFTLLVQWRLMTEEFTCWSISCTLIVPWCLLLHIGKIVHSNCDLQCQPEANADRQGRPALCLLPQVDIQLSNVHCLSNKQVWLRAWNRRKPGLVEFFKICVYGKDCFKKLVDCESKNRLSTAM